MNNLKKSYIWNTLGSGINSFTSLFFLIIVTRINGVKDAGIFTLAFATANMLYFVATYSGRTYQVTETENDIGDNEFISHRFISSLLMIIIGIIFALINKYEFYKLEIFIILCLYKATEAICDVFYGILQKNNHLDIAGKSMFFRSIVVILVFFSINYFTHKLQYSCITIVIINIIFLIIFDVRIALKYKDNKKNINYNGVIKIFKLGFYTFGVSFIANYLLNSPRYAIDAYLGTEIQTIFGIIVMPATIIMLVNQFAIQPIIVLLKDSYKEKNKRKFLKLIYIIIGVTILTGLLSIIIAYFLGIPVLNILYGLSLNAYLINLLIVLLGATIYTIASVLSNSLIILRKTKGQLVIYIISSITAFIISHKLVKLYKFNGAIYSYLITMIILLIMYIIYFIKVINSNNIWEKKEKKI